MAEIALRTYLSQIEALIDEGQIEEALAHCRHILEQLPKNIATYRLMAKGYLEAQQHREAADIFQRVLASCPDDFVAHIGMSIISEESGEANAAIWHMERAFEAQPSNRSVQDELRRLYTAREGYAPPKVRLTRGALARMYAHGGLYNQAISELRTALSEDAQRPDLQVLLAEMLLRSQQHSEAAQICQTLIETTPYNLFANRAMAEMLAREQRDIEAAPYQERVQELDPYAAQVDTRENPDDVPANSVQIEALWQQPETSTPASPAVSSEPEDLPDWLSVDMDEEPTTDNNAAAADEAPPAEKPSSLLESLESLEPGPLASEDEQLELYGTRGTAALVEDAVPEWLRELGPASYHTGELSEETPEDQPPQPRKLSWTEELRDAGLQPTTLPEDEEPPAQVAVPADESLSDSLPQSHPALEDDESLSWLESLAATHGADEDELLTTPEVRQAAHPDWAPEPAAEAESESAPSEALNWLDSLEARRQPAEDEAPTEPDEPPLETAGAEAAAYTDPAPASDDLNTDSLEELFKEAAQPPAEETPDWLKALSAEMDNPTSDPAPRALEDTPDWLNELRMQTGELKPLPETEPAADLASTEDSASAEAPTAADPAGLDWLDELGPPKHTPASEWVPEVELGVAADPQAEEASHTTELPSSPQPVAPAEDETWQTQAPSQTGQSEFAGTPVEAAPAQSLEDTEDWLARMRQSYPTPADSSEEAEDPAPGADAEPSAFEAEQTAESHAAEPAPSAQAASEPIPANGLSAARQAFAGSDLRKALQHYASLIRRRQQLPEIIADLQAASQQHPREIEVWQALGDAYMRNDQLSQALDCYTRAEDLL